MNGNLKALKEQLSAEDQKKPDKVFTVFAKSFKESSSHWQARMNTSVTSSRGNSRQ